MGHVQIIKSCDEILCLFSEIEMLEEKSHERQKLLKESDEKRRAIDDVKTSLQRMIL